MELIFSILIPVAAVTLIVILAMRIASHTFRCKHCSAEFKIKWTQVLITEHSDNEYMLVCPQCMKKAWCTMEKKD